MCDNAAIKRCPAQYRKKKKKKKKKTGKGVQLAATLMRSPDGKSERGAEGLKGVGSSKHDEETEDGSTMCT